MERMDVKESSFDAQRGATNTEGFLWSFESLSDASLLTDSHECRCERPDGSWVRPSAYLGSR